MASGVLETELKFDIPTGARLPSLRGVGPTASVGKARRMTQTAIYYDTPDLALLEARHTLRRRTGGTDAGWHLKTPGGVGDGVLLRREFTEPAGSARGPIPASLRAQVAPIVGREILLPVCVLRTVRVRRELLAADGSVLALVEDDSVQAWRPADLRGRPAGPVVGFREVEVELVAAPQGETDVLGAVSAALLEAGLRPAKLPSKLSRALGDLGLAPGPSAAVPAEVSLEADPSGARLAVWRYAAAQVGVIQALTQDVLDDAPDAVHKMRVATRRLRATLRTIRPWLNADKTQRMRRQVRWLTRTLAGARDGEVVRERLLCELDELPRRDVRGGVRRRLRRELDATHRQAHALVVEALHGPRLERLVSGLVEFVLDLPWRPKQRRDLHELLQSATRRVELRAQRADSADTAAEREFELHEVRKKGKAARYAVEAATKWAPDPEETDGSHPAEQVVPDAPQFDPKAELAAWVDLQELLGEHQDAVVARDVLRRLAAAAHEEGVDTYSYGVLVGRETQRLADNAGRVEKALRRALGPDDRQRAGTEEAAEAQEAGDSTGSGAG